MKSNEERKLRALGERLAPPHMKPLQGAPGLCELRPRQGRSDWRPVYVRRGDVFVVVALDRHDNFEALVARPQQRAAQYPVPSLSSDKSRPIIVLWPSAT